MSKENSKYEYGEKAFLTIPEQCLSKNKDGKVVVFEQELQNGNTIKKVWIRMPEKMANGKLSGYRFSIAVPEGSVFENQIKGFKTLAINKVINKDTKEEVPFIVNIEKKSVKDGKDFWDNANDEISLEDRKWTYDKLVGEIREQFSNLNARKTKEDGKTSPAMHYMWLPQEALKYNDKTTGEEKVIPTIRLVPDKNKDGVDNKLAGKFEITLPAYCGVNEIQTFNLTDGKFVDNGKMKLNFNLAKIYVDKTYEANPNYTIKNKDGEDFHPDNHDGLVGIACPDDAKLFVAIRDNESNGKTYEGGVYFVSANDLRNVVKQEFRQYNKDNKAKEKEASDIKKDVSNQAKPKEVESKAPQKEKDSSMPFK